MVEDREIKAEPYVGRFAPSPTGLLHRGSLLAAVGSFLCARKAAGQWLLRIEDLDPPREQPGSAEAIIETLALFGLEWDGPVWWQSTRHQRYAEVLAQLLEDGHAFRCACSRSDLAPSGIHPERCVRAPGASDFAVRMRVDRQPVVVEDALQGRFAQNLRDDVGDVVLRRRDGHYAYQLAVVIDDADQQISEVVRGADLLDSTPRQIALQRLLGVPTPGYLHLPVLLDRDGNKLSKSRFSRSLIQAQALAELRLVLGWLGLTGIEGDTPSAMLARAVTHFDRCRLPRQPSLPGEEIGSTSPIDGDGEALSAAGHLGDAVV